MVTVDLFDLYQKLISIVNQAQGGFIRPQVNFENWLNIASTALWKEKFSDWEKSQKITDETAPIFLKSVNIPLIEKAGLTYSLAPLPLDYGFFSSCRVFRPKNMLQGIPLENSPFLKEDGTCIPYEDEDYKAIIAQYKGSEVKEIGVNKVDNQRFGSVQNHATKFPTFDNPIITQFDGGFKVAPRGCGIIVLDYLRMPTQAKFAYTAGPDDTVIYDKVNSVQLDWSIAVEDELLARLAKSYGVYVRDWDVYKSAEEERIIAK